MHALLIVLLALGLCAPAAGKIPTAAGESTPQAEAEKLDPFGRSTPAGAVTGFLGAIGEQDYELADRYLDLSGLPARDRARAGEQLQSLLDSSGRLAPITRLTDDPAGDVLDGLAPNQERVGTLELGGKTVPVLLERRGSGDAARWVISSETLEVATSAARITNEPPLLERWSPDALDRWEVGGAPASHWLALLLVMAVAFLGLRLLLRLVLLAACIVTDRAKRAKDFLRAIATPLALLGAVLVSAISGPFLGASLVARTSLAWWSEIAGWLALGWLGFRILDAGSDRLLRRLSHKGRLNATSIIQFASRLVKLVILFATLLAMLNAAGFDVSAAIAALGIGGLAIALGAQKTTENLIASLSILSDRPFRIGEVCRFGDVVGTVEDIGMRSSRIRTLDGTLLTIPNSNLSNAEIENLSRRSKALLHPILHLPTCTPPDRVEALLSALRRTLSGDPRLIDETARVRLLVPTSDRLPIEVFGYVRTTDFDEFLEVQEDLMLKLLHVFADQGLSPAPPIVQLGTAAGARPELQLLRAG